MTGGVVSVSRSLWDDAAFRDEPFSEREAWIWLISEASWKDREKRSGSAIIKLKRGQLAHSTRFLSEAWDWHHSKVRRFLDRLEKRHMIVRSTDTGVSVIFITKYDTYQLSPNASDTAPTHRQAQHRHSTDTNENKGEIREMTSPIGEDGNAVDARSQAIWKRGVPFLSENGVPEKQARSLIGKWLKEHGSEAVFEALKDAAKAGTGDPVPYITEILKPVANVADLVASVAASMKMEAKR